MTWFDSDLSKFCPGIMFLTLPNRKKGAKTSSVVDVPHAHMKENFGSWSNLEDKVNFKRSS